MQKIKDAVVKTGEYTDNQGQTKGRYMNVGAMFKRDDGSVCLKLDALPLIHGDVWINFYDPKGREQQQTHGGGGDAPGNAGGHDDLEDSIPFVTPYPVKGMV